MYKKVDANMNFVEREKETLKFWQDNDIFKKSMDSRKEGPTYTFYDGPPTANGKPHIGHVLTRVIKDMIPRYRTMKGYMVPRKAGWDTHGLPVEIEVEKLLGINGKDQIEAYGLEPFIDHCKESVWKYKGMWEDFSRTVGFWADMDDPYVTYHNSFTESEWWALKQIYERKLLYKGFKIVPYCPRCGTPLSSHEVAQGYKCVKERSAVVRFKVKGEDAYFLAWTTTPWTLPSNVALCVNNEITSKSIDNEITHSEKLLPLIDELLQVTKNYPPFFDKVRSSLSVEDYAELLNNFLEKIDDAFISKVVIIEINKLNNKANLQALLDFILTKKDENFISGLEVCDLTELKILCVRTISNYKERSAVTPLLYCLDNKVFNRL